MYGNELEADEDDDVTGDDDLAALADTPESTPSESVAESRPEADRRAQKEKYLATNEQRKKEQQEVLSGSDEVIPRKAHDDQAANKEKESK